MENPTTRSGTSDAPTKASRRVARQLKVNPVGFGSSSPASPSTNAVKTPKSRSPNISDRKSPRSPVVTEKKRLSRVGELEALICELQDELKRIKSQLSGSKTSKEEAEEKAEALKKELEAVSSKLDESQKQLTELHSSKEADVAELKNISEQKDQAWEAQLDIIRKQHSVDASSLASAFDEIQTLKRQLEMVTQSEDRQSTNIELQSLKQNLGETLSQLESMKIEMKSCKESEAEAQELVRETLTQLEEAKQTVNSLRNDGVKSMEDYKSVASELEDSKARVTLLEGLIKKSETASADDELVSLRSELREAKSAIEELKANLMDKETELQAITEENECMILRLRKSVPDEEDERKGDEELRRLGEEVASLRGELSEKERQVQKMKEENKMMKAEIENAGSVEEVMDEAEKNKRRAERAAEQLEAAQAENAELEGELRRLKVQSDQWRKAAEAAASMLSSPMANGRLVQRTGSLDSNYLDDYDEDFKKKNGNVLRKIGGFWKKPQK